MNKLGVYSGKCFQGIVGQATGHKDVAGKPLFVGDIVLVWTGRYIGTELEEWYPCGGLTCVVNGRYTTYSNGDVQEAENDAFFVMGIKDCGFSDPEWQVRKVKDHEDVVEGEHWREYGFNYKGIEHE